MSRFVIITSEHNPAPFSTVLRYHVRDKERVVPSRMLSQFWPQPVSNMYVYLREAEALSDWLAERALGYPKLKQFEGGANWPANDWSGVEIR